MDLSDCMPDSWARASLIIRINSLANGHSGVRPTILQSMIELLRNNIVPRIPLRGSISASGDLIPLSYIGGTLQGDPAIMGQTESSRDGQRRIITAGAALREARLEPITLRPKEGLALINGTAVSTGVAALAMYDANCLAVTSQVLTAMSVEALCGARESFDRIFARVRPQPGQIEAAHNIDGFLAGSKLVKESVDRDQDNLRQGRYSIRTAAQWIGPIMEDMMLANQQVIIECNSVTDNPLIDVDRDGKSFHGGNFQAKAITSAMEKTRSGLQSLGQMLFAQCTELINPKMNNGLSPNLTADQPIVGFLSNPAGSHVQSAEMGNQSLNSLALISARYTHTALDVFTQLASVHVFALCQAFDLRAMHVKFLDEFRPLLVNVTKETLAGVLSNVSELEDLQRLSWHKFSALLDRTTSMDTSPRFTHVFESLQPIIINATPTTRETLVQLKSWTPCCSRQAVKVYKDCRVEYATHFDAAPLLGVDSCRMYRYVRYELSVPFLRTQDLVHLNHGVIHGSSENETNKPGHSDSLVSSLETGRKHVGSATVASEKEDLNHGQTIQNEHASCPSVNRPESSQTFVNANGANKPSLGSYISLIYQAFRSGELYEPVFACLDEVKMR